MSGVDAAAIAEWSIYLIQHAKDFSFDEPLMYGTDVLIMCHVEPLKKNFRDLFGFEIPNRELVKIFARGLAREDPQLGAGPGVFTITRLHLTDMPHLGVLLDYLEIPHWNHKNGGFLVWKM